jgi:multidrug efflux system membrane fusion protein
VPVDVPAVGTTAAFARVEIKSQVAGRLDEIHFREGDPVTAGDLLFSIDPRPYRSRLNQAQAALAKNRAALDNARKQAQRYGPAAQKGYVTSEQADEAETLVASLKAQVLADEAAVESARLDLENCRIKAPISGLSGELMVERGNLVKAAADQPLVTINQMSPLKISFTLPEPLLPALMKNRALGEMPVFIETPDPLTEPLVGRLVFFDHQINRENGTLQLKAEVDNQHHRLWPGQFVNLRLRLTTRRNATVIPTRALVTSQEGDLVYVVAADQSVRPQRVRVAFSAGDLTVIDEGLDVGETLVTDGQMRLKPGAKVNVLVDEVSRQGEPRP